jgi:formylglycine-generating enzyme required for sulfatase activity
MWIVATAGVCILLGSVRDLVADETPAPAAPARPPRYVPIQLDEAEAAKLQSDWAAKLGSTIETKTPTGITMTLIPPGGEAIPSPYWIGKYELLAREWQAVNGPDPAKAGGAKQGQGGDQETNRLPVRGVGWFECIQFCNRLSEKEGFEPFYAITDIETERNKRYIITAKVEVLGGDGYRLPTPAEWEHAARSGTVTMFCFGKDETKVEDYGWHMSNSGNRVHEVGEKLPNHWGLHDVYGNLREWVQESRADPQTKLINTVRCYGGSFHYKPFGSSGARWHGAAGGVGFVGVRLARNASPAAGK